MWMCGGTKGLMFDFVDTDFVDTVIKGEGKAGMTFPVGAVERVHGSQSSGSNALEEGLCSKEHQENVRRRLECR